MLDFMNVGSAVTQSCEPVLGIIDVGATVNQCWFIIPEFHRPRRWPNNKSTLGGHLVFARNSVESSDVTGNRFEWQLDQNNVILNPLPRPHFIVLDGSVKTLGVKAIEFHRTQ